MPCKKLRCRILGHKWQTVCSYRAYTQKLRDPYADYLPDPRTYQLYCKRAEDWVDVSINTFEEYYDKYCRRDSPTVMVAAPGELDGEVGYCEDCGVMHE